MIPFVAVVSLRNYESRTFRLWIPLFLIWLLLLPLGILLLRGVAAMWQILNAMTDTQLEVEHRSAGMSFHIV